MPGFKIVTQDGNEVTTSNRFPVDANVTFDASDIEIGAVELKDGTTDTRAVIDATYGLASDVKRIADGADATQGAKADSAASTDTGTFSIVALIKRGLQNWTSLLAKIPAIGPAAKAAAIPVTMATDQPAMSVTFPSAQQVSVTNVTTVSSGAVLDALATGISLDTIGFNYGFNGSTWDRLRVDSVKNLKTTTEYTALNLAANATSNAIKSGAGVLHAITINTKGASANTITVWDALTATGTKLATIDSTDQQKTLVYDAIFSTGLTIVIATGTAADITVMYR